MISFSLSIFFFLGQYKQYQVGPGFLSIALMTLIILIHHHLQSTVSFLSLSLSPSRLAITVGKSSRRLSVFTLLLSHVQLGFIQNSMQHPSVFPMFFCFFFIYFLVQLFSSTHTGTAWKDLRIPTKI